MSNSANLSNSAIQTSMTSLGIARFQRTAKLVILLTLLVSCSDDPSMASSARGTSAMSKADQSTSDESRLSEDELIEEIVRRVPETNRTMFREQLKTSTLSGFGGVEDADLSRLLGELTRRRGGELSHFPSAQIRAEKDSLPSEELLVTVEVAIAEEHVANAPRIRLVRRPDDGGVPLVVLCADASAAELSIAMRAAAESVRRIGISPTKETMTGVRVRGKPKPGSRSAANLAHLRSKGKKKEVAGIGKVRVMKMATFRKP